MSLTQLLPGGSFGLQRQRGERDQYTTPKIGVSWNWINFCAQRVSGREGQANAGTAAG